jgi:tetratricopeptide (TPR) repeat protein
MRINFAPKLITLSGLKVILFIALSFLPLTAFARPITPFEEEPKTVWDRIMIIQSYRDMNKGMAYMGMGKYQSAAKEFGRAVTENPKSPWPHILLGASLYWSGQIEYAMTEYKEALRLDGENAQAHQLMGIAYAWKGDVTNAMTSFETAAKFEPKRADIQMDIGSIYQAMGDFGKSLYYFRKAVEFEPNHPLYHYQLGNLFARLGREEDAINSYKKALRIFPVYEDAMLHMANTYERMGDLDKAVSNFKRAVRTKPGDSVARFRLALALLKQGEREKSMDVILKAFSLSPIDKDGGLALSTGYAGSSKSSENDGESSNKNPLENLEKTLRKLPLNQQAEVEIEIASIQKPKLEKKESLEKSSLKKALEQNMNKPPVMVTRRKIVLEAASRDKRQKQIDGFIKELADNLKSLSQNSEVHMNMNVETKKAASAGANQGEFNSGAKAVYNPRVVGNDMGLWVMGSSWVELIKEGLSYLDGNLDETPQKLVLKGLGNMVLGEPDKALENFERARNFQAVEVISYLGMAVSYIEKGDEAKAIEYCKEVLKLEPKNDIARENLKWLLQSEQ